MSPVAAAVSRAEHLRAGVNLSSASQSPITEVFSTPPTSPMEKNSETEAASELLTGAVSAAGIPVVIRKSSYKSTPASIEVHPPQLRHQVEDNSLSPEVPSASYAARMLHSEAALSPLSARTPRAHASSASATSVPAHLHPHSNSHSTAPTSSPASPCFVHSLLDQGTSLRSWLDSTQATNNTTIVSAASSSSSPSTDSHLHNTSDLQTGMTTPASPVNLSRALSYDRHNHANHHQVEYDSDEAEANSLTKQLAETAVGVRELSKQLGRARVKSNIQSVLIVTKARDNRLTKLTRELAIYLMKKRTGDGQRGLIVYVDKNLRDAKRFDAEGIRRDHPEFFVPTKRRSASSHSLPTMSDFNGTSKFSEEGQLRYWTSDMCTRNAHLFDFVVTLGGDGTVLFTSWLFQRIVPPVLPFALGSLGFLTNFDFADYAGVMDSAIDNGIRVNLRMRFTCTVYRAVAPEKGKGSKAVKKAETGEILMKNLDKGGWEALEDGGGLPLGAGANSSVKDKEIMCFTTRPVETFEVLNDLVVDRGPSPYVSLLELFGDEHHMTTVQADGLTVSTPTGSTAYSLSAGGSLVHPEIPALLITPICPHTLSFRPMLLPDSMELRICVPYNSRSTAWASFDGRGRVELKQGDHIKVTASKFPFPTVCADKQSTDWFHAIARTLKWNERERQKSFVVVEEGPVRKVKTPMSTNQHSRPGSIPEGSAIVEHKEDDSDEEEDDDEDDEDDDEDQEDQFDIDDSSVDNSVADSSGEPSPSISPPHKMTRFDSRGGGRPIPSSIVGSNETPDRFHDSYPKPPSLHSRHLISDSIGSSTESSGPHTHKRLHALPPVSVSASQRSPQQQLASHQRGEDGERDFIRAPESLLQSNKSKIPRDRDIEAESVRTPRPDTVQNNSSEVRPLPSSTTRTRRSESPVKRTPNASTVSERSNISPEASHAAHHHSHLHQHQLQQQQHQWTAQPPPPSRNHRRHGSVDSMGIGGPRRAFAAWGRDESDSNASDSDA